MMSDVQPTNKIAGWLQFDTLYFSALHSSWVVKPAVKFENPITVFRSMMLTACRLQIYFFFPNLR